MEENSLKSRIEEFLNIIERKKSYLGHNYVVMDIVDGNLFTYVDQALGKQLTGQPYEIARQRIPPINVLKRITDKKSKIYNQGVLRSVVDGADSDKDLLTWYQKTMRFNQSMQTANRYFNLFKNCLIQPYLSAPEHEDDNYKPALRIIPSDRFIPFSDNKDEREKPTGYILVIGPSKSSNGRDCMVYMAITNKEYIYFNSEKEDLTAQYSEDDNPNGENKLGRLPFVYMNRDEKSILPTQDSDTVSMTILIPLLLTDINFAHMFQSYSIIYTINVKDGSLKFSPNAVWSFATEPGSDQKPEVGTITPSADINGGLNLVANQFAMWLNTLGIKPGEVGDINGTNFSSGISKMLDEMDTSEDRKDQIPFFTTAEAQLWDLILHYLHPIWSEKIGQPGTFSPGASVATIFAEQVPLIRRGAVVSEQKVEVDAGFTTKRSAIKRINPHLDDSEIDQLIADIEAEKSGQDEVITDGV